MYICFVSYTSLYEIYNNSEESRKKSSSTSGPNTKREGGGGVKALVFGPLLEDFFAASLG